ncbi:ABC-type branched-chain amino acid transport system, periplasmic component [Thermanaerovibrio velox DSM 12556]|uniref:ABC-type branched-chain amino acid transport system, periplasmic component n=1 Tax=Thermanaerovibrio velox DSM 12556 TaxID=926567 RepID=H0UMY6_9BACT|nr:ABC transporter substrate-binding protein [Thermanaerovibrio velox]EHM09265.1 ABC-type branched-chain amino acid transport system, periplasmic component [Thermanaerovibrio velox DSM 12556]
MAGMFKTLKLSKPLSLAAGFVAMFLLVLLAFKLLGPREAVVALWFEHQGPGASLSRDVQQCALFAVDYFNIAERGRGLRVRPLVVTGMSDREAVDAIKKAKASVVLVGATSGFVSRVHPLLEREGIPAIATNANAPALAVEGDLLFRYSGPSGAVELGEMVRSHLPGFKRYLAVLDSSNLVYTKGQLDGFSTGLGIPPKKTLMGSPGDLYDAFRLEVVAGGYDGFYLAMPAYYAGVFMEIVGNLKGPAPCAVAGWGVSSVSASLAGPESLGYSVVFSPVELDMGHPFMRYLQERIAGLPPLPAVDSGYGAVSMALEAVLVGPKGQEGAAEALKAMKTVKTLRGEFPVDRAGDAVLPLYLVRYDGSAWRNMGEVGGR